MKAIYTIVGMRHLGTEEIVKGLQRGDYISLIRDHNNPHDVNAIEVWYAGQHVGFIKANEAKGLALWMDIRHLTACNGLFTVTADRWPQVEVEHSMKTYTKRKLDKALVLSNHTRPKHTGTNGGGMSRYGNRKSLQVDAPPPIIYTPSKRKVTLPKMPWDDQ